MRYIRRVVAHVLVSSYVSQPHTRRFALDVNAPREAYTEGMYVIDVIPLSRTAPGMLSYRSASEVPVGSIVNITIRKTLTQGIVIDSMPVSHAKELLKNSRFMLAKSTPSPAGTMPDSILRAAKRTAEYHATTTGAVLSAVFAEHIKAGVPFPVLDFSTGEGHEEHMVEGAMTYRKERYETYIQENKKAGGATLLVVPTLAELTFWKKQFKTYKPLALSGAITGARRAKALEDAYAATGLIISTPAFSWAPVQSLRTVIIERGSAGTYVLPKRPYLSMVYALRTLAEERALSCVIGDFPVPMEYRPDPALPPELDSVSQTISILDVRKDPDAPTEPSVPWRAIPEEVLLKMRAAHAAGSRLVVLGTRKGYAPAVVCRDCGQAQTDDRGRALSFSQAHGARVFVTSDGASVIPATRTCPRCGSWNLLPLGVGVERIEEELRAAFPELICTVITAEELSTPAKARKILEGAREDGILIGTEALLPWLYVHTFPNQPMFGVIASADSLLSLPFWKARERFVRLCYFFAGIADTVLLITRHPEDTAVDAVINPLSTLFWEEESILRTALQYPPFGTLITISCEGSEESVSAFQERIETDLKKYAPVVLPPRFEGDQKRSAQFIITLPGGIWPDGELSTYLSMLPPNVRVRIDPESIW